MFAYIIIITFTHGEYSNHLSSFQSHLYNWIEYPYRDQPHIALYVKQK